MVGGVIVDGVRGERDLGVDLAVIGFVFALLGLDGGGLEVCGVCGVCSLWCLYV